MSSTTPHITKDEEHNPPPRSAASTTTTQNPYALSKAQDEYEELFEIMIPPPPNFNIYKDRPSTTHQIKTRKYVHQHHMWHRSVHVWIVDPYLKLIVVQQRSPSKDTFPNRWDISAAGHIEYNKEEQQTQQSQDDDNTKYLQISKNTAVREVAEELGIEISTHELKFAFTCPAEQASWGGCNAYEDVYVVQRDSTKLQFAIGPAEVTSVKWMKISKLEQLLHDHHIDYVPRVDLYKKAFFSNLSDIMNNSNNE